jgi:hypothetical protein
LSLPYLYSQPKSQDDWRAWAFNHSANHYDWIPAITAQKNIVGLQQFLLSPIDSEEMGMWFYNHQVAHDQANAALGTSGFNLLELDWKDESQFAEWLRLNGDEHIRISGILGIG